MDRNLRTAAHHRLQFESREEGEEGDGNDAGQALPHSRHCRVEFMQSGKSHVLQQSFVVGSVFRIRIGSEFNQVSESGSVFGIRIQEGKNDQQK